MSTSIALTDSSMAILKNAKASDSKVKLVADFIRGKTIDEAVILLKKMSEKKASGLLSSVLMSAVANLKFKNSSINESSIFVKAVLIGRSSYLRRSMPSGRGRSSLLRKNRVNISVIVSKI